MIEDNVRRNFIRKIGLFTGLLFVGNNDILATMKDVTDKEGSILKASEGEIWFIGNERKAEVNIKISKTSEHSPEISLLTEKITFGDGIPVHKHLNEEEFIFIQKGRLEVTIGSEIQDAEQGDLIYVPRNSWHGFENKSNEEAIILFGYSPSGFEDYFRAIGTKSIDQNLGFTADDWIRTNNKYGVVYRN